MLLASSSSEMVRLRPTVRPLLESSDLFEEASEVFFVVPEDDVVVATVAAVVVDVAVDVVEVAVTTVVIPGPVAYALASNL